MDVAEIPLKCRVIFQLIPGDYDKLARADSSASAILRRSDRDAAPFEQLIKQKKKCTKMFSCQRIYGMFNGCFSVGTTLKRVLFYNFPIQFNLRIYSITFVMK